MFYIYNIETKEGFYTKDFNEAIKLRRELGINKYKIRQTIGTLGINLKPIE